MEPSASQSVLAAAIVSWNTPALLVDPQTVAALLLGVGPYASTECNVLWCNGKPVSEDVFRLILDVAGQISGAVAALGNTPR
ncbi:hypothetical protein [Nocardia xishanensis]